MGSTFIEAYVCPDCLIWIANGEVPESPKGWIPDSSVWWSVGDSEKDDEFSNRACECCQSPLAGTRHHVYYTLGGTNGND